MNSSGQAEAEGVKAHRVKARSEASPDLAEASCRPRASASGCESAMRPQIGGSPYTERAIVPSRVPTF